MANSNGWGDGAANNAIGWGQGANNAIAWGDSHAKSWAGATDIVKLTTDPDAQAFITAAAITDPTQQLAIDNLVKGFKSDNIWTKMKAIYPFVGGTASTHKWNLKDPRDLDAAFRLVFNGGWTHSSNGATPNGTNGYADTKLNSLNNLASQNSHFSFYNRSQTSGNMVEFASYDIATGQQFAGEIWRTFTGVSRATNAIQRIDAERLLPNYATTPNIQAFYLWNAPNINNRTIFRNNLKLAEQVISATAVNLPNNNVLLGTLDFGGTYILFSNRQAAFSTIGDGLTDTEAANLYTRVQAYQTALSRQV